MLSQITRLTIEMNPPDLLNEIAMDGSGIFDFYRAQELIEPGGKATIECLRKLD